MVILNNAYVAALAISSVVAILPQGAEACERSDLSGRVKSVLVTEALVDPATGKVGEARQVLRIDVSQDGGISETTVYAYESSGPNTKVTSHFDGGRLARQVETADGKTVSTTNCSYDAEGRLVEATTQSVNGERSTVQTYQYGSGFIRRRTRVFGRWYVINQTLDANDRVIKEVELDEERSTIERTREFAYSGDRKEECVISPDDPRRHCGTTVRDSHGNEIEAVTEGQTRKTSFQYDSVGNWVSKRTTITGPRRASALETVVRRKIEYW